MNRIHSFKLGLALGVLMGGLHLVWALLVAFQAAQPILNFLLWLHFIKPIYVVEPFRLEVAVDLVAFTTLGGFAIGYLFGAVWNWMHPESSVHATA